MNKHNLAEWSQAVKRFENGDLKTALELFQRLGNHAKSSFNIGMIYCKIGYYHSAESVFKQAIEKDPFFGAAIFQRGHSLLILKHYVQAKKCFLYCVELLLDNDWIDYKQLGLDFKLYRCEVLFNLVVCLNQLGDMNRASRYLTEAKQIIGTANQHAVILVEYYHRGNVLPFSIPCTAIFTVPEKKLKNLERKDFLTEAKLVVDTDPVNPPGFVGFTGAMILNPVLDWENGVTTLVREKIVAPKRAKPRKSFTMPFTKRIKDTAVKVLSKTLPRGKKSDQKPGVAVDNTHHREGPSTPSNRSSTSKGTETVMESSQTLKLQKAKIYPRKSSLPSNYTAKAAEIPPVPKLKVSQFLTKLMKSSAKLAPDSGFEDLSGNTVMRNTSDQETDIADLYDNFSSLEVSSQITIILHAAGGNGTFTFTTDRNITLEAFQKQTCSFLNVSKPAHVCFTEEDDPDCFISIVDQDDLTLALDTNTDTTHFYIRGGSDILYDWQ